MSRTLKIEGLSDAQCDALAEEAKFAGRKFYDHCRMKLLANTAIAAPEPVYGKSPVMLALPDIQRENARAAAEVREPDRIGRLEAMMEQMGEAISRLAQGGLPIVAEETDNPEIDVDDVIGESLRAAERQGLTDVAREQPAHAGGVRHIGQRRPAPYSVNSVPHHLRNL